MRSSSSITPVLCCYQLSLSVTQSSDQGTCGITGLFAFINSVLMSFILTFDNGFSRIIYSFIRGRQNIFLPISSSNFVVKCAAHILKIG